MIFFILNFNNLIILIVKIIICTLKYPKAIIASVNN